MPDEKQKMVTPTKEPTVRTKKEFLDGLCIEAKSNGYGDDWEAYIRVNDKPQREYGSIAWAIGLSFRDFITWLKS
jgi:hypothetical protein